MLICSLCRRGQQVRLGAAMSWSAPWASVGSSDAPNAVKSQPSLPTKGHGRFLTDLSLNGTCYSAGPRTYDSSAHTRRHAGFIVSRYRTMTNVANAGTSLPSMTAIEPESHDRAPSPASSRPRRSVSAGSLAARDSPKDQTRQLNKVQAATHASWRVPRTLGRDSGATLHSVTGRLRGVPQYSC